MMTFSERDKFVRSCVDADDYPKNLIYHDTYDHILDGYRERLDEQEKALFFDESKSSLCVHDFDEQLHCFESINLCSKIEVEDYFSSGGHLNQVDPRCRFVFVHAPHSRERLRTTRQMLVYTMTYHQVMPTFLDFIFPFGKQQYAQDFQFSGFRHEDRLSIDEIGLDLPELGRSGQDIRMCYNLRSVEPSQGQKEWPWSIRQTAAYHSFDMETGKAFWTIVKGDQLMKKRMEAATSPGKPLVQKYFHSLTSSFSSTFTAHLVIFDWCREHWRWYINFLEQELQNSTRKTLLVDLDNSRGQTMMSPSIASPQLNITTSKVSSFPISLMEKMSWRTDAQLKHPPPYAQSKHQPASSPQVTVSPQESEEYLSDDESFSFGDLQKVQSLEEKANEALLVQDSNINILSEIKQYYHDLVASDEFPQSLRKGCARDVAKFEKNTAGIINDLQIHQSRTNMLLRLLTDRKSLLYGILDYRNMESNKLFASKAQLSTENMEIMTQDMHEIAQKTKQETVSMRIITLVTLFFLPGTFISTIMSTDIVQYQVADDGKSHEVFQLGALQLYLAITLPMMLLTFGSWYGVYFWVDRKEKAKIERKKIKDGV